MLYKTIWQIIFTLLGGFGVTGSCHRYPIVKPICLAQQLRRARFYSSWYLTSVSRLGDFLQFLVTNFPSNVAEVYCETLAISKNITL